MSARFRVRCILIALAGIALLLLSPNVALAQGNKPPKLVRSTMSSNGVVNVSQLPEEVPSGGQPIPLHMSDSAALLQWKQDLDNQRSQSETVQHGLLQVGTSAQTDILTSFAGLRKSQSGGKIPPDTQVAAGPNHIVEAVNVALRILNKSGASVQTISLNNFFGFGPNTSIFDPRVRFDSLSNRWFIAAAAPDAWLLAVSSSSDPTGTFSRYTFPPGNCPDFPGLGISNDKVVLTANAFTDCSPGSSGSFIGTEFLVINKSQVLAGVLSPATQFGGPHQGGHTIRPAHSLSSTNTLFMAAGGDENVVNGALISTSTLFFWTVNGVPGVGSGATAPFVTRGIRTLNAPPDAVQPGTLVPLIRTFDARPLDAVFRGGFMWISATSACVPSGGSITRACLRFIEINTSGPTIRQDFDFGIPEIYHYYPAIQVDSAGNLLTVFSRSSSSEFAAVYASGRLASDPLNSLQSPRLVKPGEALYNALSDGFTLNRWGDYSGAGVDPSDQGKVWVAGEYSRVEGGSEWGTWIAQIQIVPSNPTPSLSSILPSSATAGGPAFTPTINGSGFVSGSVVRWNGSDRGTSFVSSIQLTAAIPASDIASSGTAQVMVFSPSPGGGTSNALTFIINNPMPSISSLSPSSVIAGASAFALTVNGSGFVPSSVVRWNGSDRTTTFVSGSQLQASIPASDVASAGTAQVTVFNTTPGGGTSGALTFTINNPVPTITQLQPVAIPVGSGGFNLTVNGFNYVTGSVVRWNGSDRPTTFVNSTQLVVAIASSDLVNAGTAQVTVFNPAPGGGVSSAVTFTILSPVITQLVPDNIPETSPEFTLTVNGSNFIPTSIVRWNGSNRATTFVSSNQLTATILSSDVASVGTANVTVFNSAGTGGVSNSLTFTITIRNPLPTVTGLSPAGVLAGSPPFTLTVTGSNFVFNAVVRWNGADRTTTFVSGAQLQASIPASDVAVAGNATVTVFNPAPGGGESNAITFTINQANNPVPQIADISPNNVVAGSVRDFFTLTVNGSNFVSSSVARWNGQNRTTTFVNSNQLQATIGGGDVASAGTAQVTVFNPAPGGGTSNAVTFTTNNPVPTIISLSPSSATAGGPAFTLNVSGSSFVPGAVVRWNGTDRPTTFFGSNLIGASIPAGDIAAAGTATITVVNPGPEGGPSNPLAFTINP